MFAILRYPSPDSHVDYDKWVDAIRNAIENPYYIPETTTSICSLHFDRQSILKSNHKLMIQDHIQEEDTDYLVDYDLVAGIEMNTDKSNSILESTPTLESTQELNTKTNDDSPVYKIVSTEHLGKQKFQIVCDNNSNVKKTDSLRYAKDISPIKCRILSDDMKTNSPGYKSVIATTSQNTPPSESSRIETPSSNFVDNVLDLNEFLKMDKKFAINKQNFAIRKIASTVISDKLSTSNINSYKSIANKLPKSITVKSTSGLLKRPVS